MTIKTELINDPASCDWLRTTHLKGIPNLFRFNSFVLYGNEDCPERVDLYDAAEPKVGDSYRRVDFCPGTPVYCTVMSVATKTALAADIPGSNIERPAGYTPVNLDDMAWTGERLVLGKVYAALSIYCENKSLAIQLRATGHIVDATRVEKECDAIYKQLPKWAQW